MIRSPGSLTTRLDPTDFVPGPGRPPEASPECGACGASGTDEDRGSCGVARFRSERILSVRGGQVVVHRLNADAAGSGKRLKTRLPVPLKIPVRNP
jgi:hypothetical protein